MGSTCTARIACCADENVPCDDDDCYVGACIAIHGFAHTFHERGMQALCPDIFQRVRQLYNNRNNRIFLDGAYASENDKDFFAVMIIAFSNCRLSSVSDDRQSFQTRVPELSKGIVATWDTDGVDRRHNGQRCPTMINGRKIKIECSDF